MKNLTSRPISPDGTQAIVVKSDDGDVCFRLRSTPLGLWVQRERRRKDSRARLVLSVVFRDAAGFSRWCEADSVRFDYPIVFSIIKREGGALLESHEQSSVAVRDHEEH